MESGSLGLWVISNVLLFPDDREDLDYSQYILDSKICNDSPVVFKLPCAYASPGNLVTMQLLFQSEFCISYRLLS